MSRDNRAHLPPFPAVDCGNLTALVAFLSRGNRSVMMSQRHRVTTSNYGGPGKCSCAASRRTGGNSVRPEFCRWVLTSRFALKPMTAEQSVHPTDDSDQPDGSKYLISRGGEYSSPSSRLGYSHGEADYRTPPRERPTVNCRDQTIYQQPQVFIDRGWRPAYGVRHSITRTGLTPRFFTSTIGRSSSHP